MQFICSNTFWLHSLCKLENNSIGIFVTITMIFFLFQNPAWVGRFPFIYVFTSSIYFQVEPPL